MWVGWWEDLPLPPPVPQIHKSSKRSRWSLFPVSQQKSKVPVGGWSCANCVYYIGCLHCLSHFSAKLLTASIDMDLERPGRTGSMQLIVTLANYLARCSPSAKTNAMSQWKQWLESVAQRVGAGIFTVSQSLSLRGLGLFLFYLFCNFFCDSIDWTWHWHLTHVWEEAAVTIRQEKPVSSACAEVDFVFQQTYDLSVCVRVCVL